MPAIAPKYLLDDAQLLDFIARGYHLVEPQAGDFPEGFHASIVAKLDQIKSNPGNGILDAVPELKQIYDNPRVLGPLMSVLGKDVEMDGHRHLHTVKPHTPRSQTWHQDGTNVRHHQTWCCLAMYYPQDVTPEMGPTAVLPGTHLRNAPTDTMSNYGNIKGTEFLTVRAGTVAITHYDLWHAATLSRSDRPRYMLKFLFNRKSAPLVGRPSWRHDAKAADQIIINKTASMVGPIQHYCSDYYKEWELRREMWEWYLGSQEKIEPGAFRTLLSR
ncbi:MAG: phytanoyl-CoA dioxygenase family protein [Planctomycetota bacterium]|nr:phytanoyl-CoA dioxygenase family protein [Planctomycetota bacterium]